MLSKKIKRAVISKACGAKQDGKGGIFSNAAETVKNYASEAVGKYKNSRMQSKLSEKLEKRLPGGLGDWPMGATNKKTVRDKLSTLMNGKRGGDMVKARDYIDDQIKKVKEEAPANLGAQDAYNAMVQRKNEQYYRDNPKKKKSK